VATGGASSPVLAGIVSATVTVNGPLSSNSGPIVGL
jgi:hypothetical protein